jgi:pimeloyl-ACP methyl ester carboxylesterase
LHHKESAQKALEDYLQRFTYRREHITSKTSALKYAGDISQKMSDILNESGFTDSESISSKSGDDTAIHIDDCFLENLMLESEPDLWIPVTLFNPVDRKSHKAPSLIIAYPEGRWFFARTQEKLIRKITSRGIIVLLADIRFMGEMGGVDWRNNQQILGRYEIGMGARDLYAAARYLRARVDTAPDQIACLASGDAGLAAMAAAALGARFTSIILDDIGPTYAAGRNEPAPYNLLAVGDLPELFCAAGAADLYINTVDKEQFEFTRQYYAAIGLQEKLHLTATADYMARKEGIECFLASFGTHETAEDARAHTQDTLDLVLKNERSNRVYGPVTVAVPDYAGLPAFGMLKAEKPDCPALPYVRTEAGISLIADLPARQTVTYQISPGEIRTHRPANASKINTQVWPDGFCLNLEFGKVYIGLYIGCADDGDMFEKVKWLNMANIRKTTNCLFEKQVFHYFNNEWHILLTVISYTGGFVDVHASLSFRGADRPDKLHLAYLYIPANGTWEVKIKTDQENAIIIEPQNGHLHHADWLFCADTVQKRYILGSDVTQSGLPVQNKPFAIIRSDDKLLLLKQWSISNKQGKEQPVSQTMRFYRADEVTEDADLPHFYVYRSLLSDDQLQVVFSA